MFQEDKIESIVNKIQKVYFIFICFGIFSVIYISLGLSEKFGGKKSLELIISLIVFLTIYFGLRLRKKWVIPFILIMSAFAVFRELIAILQTAEGIGLLIGKFISVMLLLFYAYQINFFSKREVKTFFKSQGIVLF
jgi:hypothetical protein